MKTRNNDGGCSICISGVWYCRDIDDTGHDGSHNNYAGYYRKNNHNASHYRSNNDHTVHDGPDNDDTIDYCWYNHTRLLYDMFNGV